MILRYCAKVMMPNSTKKPGKTKTCYSGLLKKCLRIWPNPFHLKRRYVAHGAIKITEEDQCQSPNSFSPAHTSWSPRLKQTGLLCLKPILSGTCSVIIADLITGLEKVLQSEPNTHAICPTAVTIEQQSTKTSRKISKQ